MATTQTTRRNGSIIGAIVGKDLLDALKNRTMLTIILGVAFTLLTSQALPLLISLRGKQIVYVYEYGEGTLSEALASSDLLDVHAAPSIDIVQALIGEAVSAELGLIFPASTALGDGPITLDGYLPYWVSPSAQADIIQLMEEQINAQTGMTVEIRTHAVYPEGPMGRHFMTSITLVLVLMLMGIFVTPYLLLDEKESHTLDALLVSPANPAQIVTGKALVGLIYCLVTAAIVLFINARTITDLGMLTLAVLIGSAMFIGIGLLLGSLFNSMTNLNLAASGVSLIMLLGVMLTSIPGLAIPPAAMNIIHWIPTAALNRVIEPTLSGGSMVSSLWLDLGSVLAFGLVAGALVVWQLRREDR